MVRRGIEYMEMEGKEKSGKLNIQAKKRELFRASVFENGMIYSFSVFKNLPIMIDLRENTINLLDNLKNYDISFIPDDMLAIKDMKDIFVLEMNGNRLMSYNIEKRNCKYFEIGCNREEWGNFAMLSIYKKKVYIFPKYFGKVIKVDKDSGLVSDDVQLKINIQCGCQIENIVWLFQEKGNSVIAYNMEDDTWRAYKLPIELDNCIHVIEYNKKFCFLSSEGRVFLWDAVDGAIEKICDCSDVEETSETYIRIAASRRALFLLPSLGKDIFKIDMDTKKIEKYEKYPKDFQYCELEQCSKYNGYCESEKFYFFSMRSANYMLCIDKYTDQEKWIKLQSPLTESYMKVYAKYKKMTFNEAELDKKELEFYLKNINKEEEFEKYSSIGRAIWKQIKNG